MLSCTVCLLTDTLTRAALLIFPDQRTRDAIDSRARCLVSTRAWRYSDGNLRPVSSYKV